MVVRDFFLLLLLSQCVTDTVLSDGACEKEVSKIHTNLIGAMVPQCDEKTGNYKPVQCWASVGNCWCVDIQTGKKIEPLVENHNEVLNCEPNCLEELKKVLKSPSILIHGEPKLLFADYIPNCDAVSGYFRPKQCLQNNKQCWCVSKLGKEQENTKTTDVGNMECNN